ncbi:MAG TPA: dihydroxyacetone kinase subunit DhaL [Bacillales bacterium]|nr:dihydroxyacetone kinase subunit DhaL [Bacillales bacterium]
MNVEQLKGWIRESNERIQEKKAYLSELDQAIGDGDHGTNLARGFAAADSTIAEKEYEDCGALLQAVSMALISKVGGASGPLFGTAFMKMAAAAKGKENLSKNDWGSLLQEAANGIKMRGKAEIGEKTMLDVWQPAADYMTENGEEASWDRLKSLCEEKMETTKEMEAKKGRASYLGKRSVGHLDPGSVSSCYILTALAESGAAQ